VISFSITFSVSPVALEFGSPRRSPPMPWLRRVDESTGDKTDTRLTTRPGARSPPRRSNLLLSLEWLGYPNQTHDIFSFGQFS
jgi:hypothetical protein